MAEQIKIFDDLISLDGNKTAKDVVKTIGQLVDVFKDLEKQLIKTQKAQQESAKTLKSEIESLNKTDHEIISLTQSAKKLSEQHKTTKTETEKVKKAQDQLTEAQKEANKIAAKTEKLTNDVAFAKTDEAKALAKLKVELVALNKENRDAAKASTEEDNAYKKKSKRLNDLRNDYKKLRAEEGKATKETDDLKRSIQKLDTELKEIDADVGQFQRSVGNYEKALESLNRTASGFNIVNIAAAFELGSTLGEISEEASGETKETLDELATGFKVAQAEAGKFFGAFLRDAKKTAKDIKDNGFFSGIASAEFSEVSKAIDEFSADEFGEKIEKATEQQNELTKSTIEQRNAVIDLSKTLANQEGVLDKLELQRDAEGVSLQERSDKNIEIAKQEVAVANTREALIKSEIDLLNQQIEIAETGGLASLQLREELAAKQVELIEATNQAELQRLETIKEGQTLEADIIEQRLDILIDGADNAKTINERIIGDETISAEKKKQLLKESQELQEKAITKQVETLQKAAKQQIDINDLIATSDSEELANKIQATGLSERLSLRLLEIVREQRTANLDLIDSQKELNQEFSDTTEITALANEQKIYNLQLQGAKDNNKLREQIERDHQERIIQIQLEALQRQLQNAEEGSIRQAELLLQIEELKTNQLQTQVTEAEQVKAVTEERRDLEAEILGLGVDQLAQLGKNQQAMQILVGTAKVFIAEFARSGSFGSFQQASAGAAQSSATGGSFAHGGYTGDGGKFEEAGVVHKGEYVIDKETTAALGMKNVDMNTLSRAVESTKVSNQLKQGQSLAVALAPQPVREPEPIDYARLGAEVGKNIPSYDFTAVGHHYVTVKEQNKELTRVIHKSKNHIFTPKQIPNNPF